MWLACDCGAEDCPDCGPAQGHKVVRVWRNGRLVWANPDPDAEPTDLIEDDYPEPA